MILAVYFLFAIYALYRNQQAGQMVRLGGPDARPEISHPSPGSPMLISAWYGHRSNVLERRGADLTISKDPPVIVGTIEPNYRRCRPPRRWGLPSSTWGLHCLGHLRSGGSVPGLFYCLQLGAAPDCALGVYPLAGGKKIYGWPGQRH